MRKLKVMAFVLVSAALLPVWQQAAIAYEPWREPDPNWVDPDSPNLPPPSPTPSPPSNYDDWDTGDYDPREYWYEAGYSLGPGPIASLLLAPFEYETGHGADQSSYMDTDPDGSEAMTWFNAFRAEYEMPQMPNWYDYFYGDGVDPEWIEAIEEALNRASPRTLSMFPPGTFKDARGNTVTTLKDDPPPPPATLAEAIARFNVFGDEDILVTGSRILSRMERILAGTYIQTDPLYARLFEALTGTTLQPSEAEIVAYSRIQSEIAALFALLRAQDTRTLRFTTPDGTAIRFSMREFAHIFSNMNWSMMIGYENGPGAAGGTSKIPGTQSFFAIMTGPGAIGYANAGIDMMRYYVAHEISHNLVGVKRFEREMRQQFCAGYSGGCTGSDPYNARRDAWRYSNEARQLEIATNTAARAILLNLDQTPPANPPGGGYYNVPIEHGNRAPGP